MHGGTVDGEDNVVRLNSGVRGRAIRIDVSDYRGGAIFCHFKLACQVGIEVCDQHTQVTARDASVALELLDVGFDAVDRNGEADPLRTRVDRAVNADHFAFQVD